MGFSVLTPTHIYSDAFEAGPTVLVAEHDKMKRAKNRKCCRVGSGKGIDLTGWRALCPKKKKKKAD